MTFKKDYNNNLSISGMGLPNDNFFVDSRKIFYHIGTCKFEIGNKEDLGLTKVLLPRIFIN